MSTTKKSSTVDCSWHTIKTNLRRCFGIPLSDGDKFPANFLSGCKNNDNECERQVCMYACYVDKKIEHHVR